MVDAASRRTRRVFHGEQREQRNYTVNSLMLSPDEAILIAGVSFDNRSGFYGGEVRIWDVATGRLRTTVPAAATGAGAVTVSPDGKVVAYSAPDGSVRLWEITEGQEVAKLGGSTGGLTSSFGAVAFSPDGKTLVGAENYSTFFGTLCRLRFWDVATHQQRQVANHQDQSVVTLAYSPDGKTLAAGLHYRNFILLLDAATGEERGRLEGVPRAGVILYAAMS
jgi:WD40 repeat protein